MIALVGLALPLGILTVAAFDFGGTPPGVTAAVLSVVTLAMFAVAHARRKA